MIARLAWYALLLGVAVIAFSTQLDRQVINDRQLAAFVPTPVRSVAQQRLTDTAIRSNRADIALPMARELVGIRPMPAENLILLAQAEALTGEPERSVAALEAATSRGWRQPVAQIAVADAALAMGDYGAAADRLAALIAIGATDDVFDVLITRQLSAPEGREAIALRMAGPGHWQDKFIRVVIDVVEPADLADTLARAESAGAQLPCNVLSQAATNLQRRGYPQLAERFWPGDCPTR